MKKIYTGLLIIFSVFWVSFILLDYIQKHPQYAFNYKFFQYWDLFAFVFSHAIIGGVLFHFFKSKLSNFLRGGLMIIPGILLVALTYVLALNNTSILKNNVPVPTPAKFNEIIYILMNYFKVGLQVLLIILSSYSVGQWLVSRTSLELKPASKTAISIGTGIMIIVMLAFILGIFKLLYWFTLGPVLIACLALNYKSNLFFLKNILVSPIKPSKYLGFIGVCSMLLLLFVVQLNLAQNVSPFPKGFDSMALYVKLPTNINDYHGLVRGYQPYNWSLLMSFGLILFNSLETVLALSFVGGVLCLVALYAIGKDVLKMNQNYILLSLLIFYILPSVGFQSFQEQKVDLGLLFIILCLVLLLFAWIKSIRSETYIEGKVLPELIKFRSVLSPYLILMGLFTGFAFGIKLTTLFSYFSIIAIIWFLEFGFIGFLGSSLLCCFAILLVKLDDMSGMREYHLSANYVQWILLLFGLSTFIYLFMKSKKGFIRTIGFSVVYTIFFGVMSAPWVVKNFIDSDMTLSFRYLMNGKTNEPAANLRHFQRIQKQQQRLQGKQQQKINE